VLDKGDPVNRDQFYEMYSDSKRPIDREKLKRQSLRGYLSNSKPHSSLEVLQSDLQALSDEAKRNVQTVETAKRDVDHLLTEVRTEQRRTRRVEVGALIGFAIAAIAIVIAFDQIFHDDMLATRAKVDDIAVKVMGIGSTAKAQFTKALDARVADSQQQLRKVTDEAATQRQELDRLRHENELLRKRLDDLTTRNAVKQNP
jgi:hypothetical protein